LMGMHLKGYPAQFRVGLIIVSDDELHFRALLVVVRWKGSSLLNVY